MSEILRPDLCIIGAGAAGLSVAASAAALGVSTVLIERGVMGGECLNTGCVPSKALIAAARAAKALPDALRSADTMPAAAPPSFQRAMAHVKGAIAEIAPADSAARYTALGVTVLKSEAAFIDRSTVEAGGARIQARRFVIASGSRPTIPDLAGLDAVPYLTNETVFDLPERPGHLIIVGGGPMGCELGQAFRRLGSEVTLFEMGTLLPREDPELAGILRGALARDGVVLHEQSRLAAVSIAEGGVRVHYTDSSAAPRQVSGSHILVAVGRTPSLAGLSLDAAFIKHDKSGIIVDYGMRCSNRRVFAIGDCAGGAAGGSRFTHAASLQASLVVRSALFRMPVRFDPVLLPRVTFTDPEIAAVGLSEEEARAKYGRIRLSRFPFGETDRARTEAKAEGLVKLIAKPNGRILGAAICAESAGEMIGLWALALQEKMKLSQIARLTLPYPTLSEASRRAALEFYAPLARRPLLRRLLRILRAFG
ncbi:Pyruvate/2-oxoglutarate dehydrogenase complex, dihydrolipoamide dehydrogenase (E3) component [Rhizobiales bacterium GAS113]|jgi:pyruvate/2-oxoglutarate dehydrogenase complex dihydrolipoamide dehydrogenase (E3) component|nr:Pyruvate/2-oxoglutarate dehydrogenase complex, dihydrolipoamide dehydrogenase (E3) component [Rhizobiales bacterium GAS113]SEB82891.1 Pyruvate/2-oxoglutarate dehydrogenase complex, dihydrolipoamide dehydrogenase (E3) component [Rhizobiales bacterium GAS188]